MQRLQLQGGGRRPPSESLVRMAIARMTHSSRLRALGRISDLVKSELHLFETGHFALEEGAPAIAHLMLDFFQCRLVAR
ncbi:hypothetical protein [Arvimicrobium flavum]|uniref:hypothetical protein n=1 Tax=Arvimicrobium flavum TaxID=3393320 RepID=UPI00237ADDBC|nr:hypothetical protein [Mesorhizobium shangrilense]